MLEKLGKYEIRLQIGRGAMGTVFEGFDPAIGRRVAIKTLRTEMFEQHQLPEVLQRFKREAQSAGRLSHPHIVTIHEYGEEAGTPYIVMEYINGKELGHELDRGVRFRLEDVVRLMTQLLGALAHAHENGVVHRDLKPANMFVLEDGSLKVVDFGIARLESSNLTETGAMLGTPAYMSPEQIMALAVDHKSDLFSAGVILYQLLTGDKPFTGSVTSVMQKVLKQDALPPSELNPTLSEAWDAVISRAMAKKPEARYATARQFAEAIKLAQQAERAHEEESRRKADEAREHALRETERRSREEAKRREDAALAEIARKEREEQAQRTVALPSEPISATPRAPWAKLVVAGALTTTLAVAAIWGFLAYQRSESARQAAKAEASRASDEVAKAEAASKQRAEQEAAAARKAQDARKEAERLAQAQASELARREAEEKAKKEAQHKQEESKRKEELAAKAKARAEADASEKARKDQLAAEAAKKEKENEAARQAAEARTLADRKAAEEAYAAGADYLRQSAYWNALEKFQFAARKNFAPAQVGMGDLYMQGIAVNKDPVEALRWYQKAADQGYELAIKKLEAAKKTKEEPVALQSSVANRRQGYDGTWSGTYSCGGLAHGKTAAFTNRVVLLIAQNGQATLERSEQSWRVKMSGVVENDGSLSLDGEGSDTTSVWWIKFRGKLTDSSYEATGELGARGASWRECWMSLRRN